VNLYKFEIERLKEQMSEMKKEYYQKRAREEAERYIPLSKMNGDQFTIPYAYTGVMGDKTDNGLMIGGH